MVLSHTLVEKMELPLTQKEDWVLPAALEVMEVEAFHMQALNQKLQQEGLQPQQDRVVLLGLIQQWVEPELFPLVEQTVKQNEEVQQTELQQQVFQRAEGKLEVQVEQQPSPQVEV